MSDGTSPIHDYPRGITFEQVWAALLEDRQQMKEMREQLKENTDELRRDLKKTERLVKANAKQMGGLSNTFGKMVEHLVAPGIVSAFNKQGYHFDAIAYHGMIIQGKDGKTRAEIDLLLENGDTIIAVEVKSNAKTKHIKELSICLEILREHRKDDKRKIHGAIAGAMFAPGVKDESLNSGFYVIEQSGDTMKMNIPPDFLPKAW